MSKNLIVLLIFMTGIFQVYGSEEPDIVKYRKMWEEYTKGNNLALGKKFIFSKRPDYHLTVKGDSDSTDLTDGKISNKANEKIWFDAATVGWYMAGAENGVNCLLDLGEVKPVSDVVIRALAGRAQTNLAAPNELKVFVSRDGKDFYESAGMTALMEGEKAQSDFFRYYFLEEKGVAYAYPFKLQVNADARFIGVYFKGTTGAVFMDEIAVMEGAVTSAGFNEAYKGPKEKFITDGLIVEPRLKELAVSTNINTPNVFLITDMRDKSIASTEVKLCIDVPEGVNMLYPEASEKSVDLNGERYTRLELPLKRHKKTNYTERLFFHAGKSVNAKLPAYIFTECKGISSDKVQVPVRLIEIPEVKPQFRRLVISLAWMGESWQMRYPDFLRAYKAMGFNTVPCFPRNWVGESETKNDIPKYLETARKEGFPVLMNESPFHVMMIGHKEGSEIFSQLKSGKPSKNLCPSYWGDYYVKEMDRVAANVKNSNPDYVTWDIECWRAGATEAEECSRCIEEQKKSSKSMKEYLKGCGTRKMKDLKDAVKRGTGDGKMPLLQCYNTQPIDPDYGFILDFNRFYPASVDFAGSSLYVVGNAQKVHDLMRENCKILKNNNNIPWLSPGTYGEFQPYKLEQMILEALMNGACGIYYFSYSEFDTPMDFYYHSKALAEIAPYEDILLDGEKLFDLAGSNKNLTYSAVRKGNEMLLLIGNYKRDSNGETEIILPVENISEIWNLRDNGKKIHSGQVFKTNIPVDQIGFFYIR